MRYVYYDPVTRQGEAYFDTPILSAQSAWESKGFFRAVVPPEVRLSSLDYKIDAVVVEERPGEDTIEVVRDYSDSPHPRTNGIT